MKKISFIVWLFLCWNAFSEQGEFIPNDEYFSKQWGLKNSEGNYDVAATKAWHLERGSNKVAIVIIDTGVDYDHPDLINNMWTNPNEIPNNGIDDDNNGYVDDIHGINTITGSGDPMDDHGHGTMQAGVIGAEGNNGIGIAGVMHNVSLIACKFLSASGGGTTEDAVECLDYVADLAKRDIGVTIVATHNAWGGGPSEDKLYQAIQTQRDLGILFVATCGGEAVNIDENKTYPASYDLSNIIVVATGTGDGALTGFSSFGPNTVHMVAPGESIFTTSINNTYEWVSGTAALGFVSGIIGLLKSRDLSLDSATIKQKILASVVKLKTLEEQSKIMTGGFINAFLALSN